MAVTRRVGRAAYTEEQGTRRSPVERFRQWSASSHGMVSNTVSLIGTTGISSGLGYLYWMVAARLFEPAAVGFGGASISAIGLLGAMSVLGLGTLLIGELPRRPGEELGLIARALGLSGAAGLASGVLFALAAPLLAPGLAPLAVHTWSTLLFAAGVSLTTMTMVLDQALLGLLRGPVQFWRNAAFAVLKLAALLGAGFWLAGADGETIVATWVAGLLLSMTVALLLIGRAGPDLSRRVAPATSDLESVADRRRRLGRSALAHHALNVALQVPFLTLLVGHLPRLSPLLRRLSHTGRAALKTHSPDTRGAARAFEWKSMVTVAGRGFANGDDGGK